MMKKGEITVFLSMISLCFVAFIYAIIRLAQISENQAKAEIIAEIAINSAFAEYSKVLWDKYGLLYVDTSYNGAADGSDDLFLCKFVQYIDVNSALSSSISYLSSDASEISHATDNGFESVIRQIRSYTGLTYAVDEEVIDTYISNNKYLSESFEKTGAYEEYDCYEKLEKMISFIEEDMKESNSDFRFNGLIEGAEITVYMEDSKGKIYEATRKLSLTK